MDKKQKLVELHQFLNKYQSFWKEEILWNKNISNFFKNLANHIQNYSPQELIDLEAFKDHSFIKNPEYHSFLKSIFQLNLLPKYKEDQSISIRNRSGLHLTPKKNYELNQIYSILKNKNISHIMDYAGGRGLSSTFLASNMNTSSTCIDFDRDLIESGVKRKDEFFQNEDVSFIQTDLKKEFPQKKNSLHLSLHNCGELSVIQIRNLKPHSGFLNIPCCYHKGLTFNLSSTAQLNPINYSPQALHCAAKSYKLLSIKDFEQRQRVKSFRYSYELYLKSKDINQERIATKSKAQSLYMGSFANYCKQLEVPAHFNLSEAIKLFESIENKEQIKQMIYLGIIRNLFGRLIEVAICLDRSIYLEEKGISNVLIEIFSNKYSPRNIAIISK